MNKSHLAGALAALSISLALPEFAQKLQDKNNPQDPDAVAPDNYPLF